MKRNIRLLISYDGTDFAGWQKQRDYRTVQGVLEEALASLHETPTPLVGAGRTDSGVHATGQVGNFYSLKENIEDGKFSEAINVRLPKDVRVLSSGVVPEGFHSKRDAKSRQYAYWIASSLLGTAHMSRYAWFLRKLPSLAALNEMARVICGSHDFTAFTARGDTSKSRIRSINHAVFLSRGPMLVFRIDGNAFLWRMVRSLLGTMVDLALFGGGGREMKKILNSRDRSEAGPTAPARGLFLTRVDYE